MSTTSLTAIFHLEIIWRPRSFTTEETPLQASMSLSKSSPRLNRLIFISKPSRWFHRVVTLQGVTAGCRGGCSLLLLLSWTLLSLLIHSRPETWTQTQLHIVSVDSVWISNRKLMQWRLPILLLSVIHYHYLCLDLHTLSLSTSRSTHSITIYV